MKKFWQKVHSKGSDRSTSGSSGQRSSADSDSQAHMNGDTVNIAVRAANVVALSSIGTPILSQSQNRQLQRLSPSSSHTAAISARKPSPSTGNNRLNTAKGNIPAPSGNIPGWKTTAYSGVKMALEVVRESSDVFVPLKSVAGGLSALLKQYDQFISNKDDVQRLILRVESLVTSLTGPPGENDTKEIERRNVLEKLLALETLDSLLNQSNFSGFLNNADQAAKITGVVEDIRDAILDYQTSLQQGLNDNTMTIMESVLFDKLPCAKGAGYESGNREKCLRGTRVKVLETIENWVQQHHKRRVYWLNGIAGTGKTTIAQSFAERLFAEGLLGASFFCSRDFPDRRELYFIFPTLAFQLAYKYPNFRARLVQILTTNPNVGHESLSNQLNKLLVEPLRSVGLSTVIIIDALDECEDEQPASAILSLLSRTIDQVPLVKFFITGRPEPQIRSGFRLPAMRPQTEIMLLHEIERGNVDEDIKTFLTYRLKELVENRSDLDLTTPWPTPEDIQIITSKAGGLFIYASTVIKFMASASHNPQERLWMIVSMPNSSIYEGQLGIDPLYTCVFDKSCAHIHGSDFNYFSRLLLIISSLVLLCEPISVASLATLLGVGPNIIFTSIRSLHSVVLVPDSDTRPIRVFHKSFPDYITDRERCKDPRFYVDSPAHHARLAIKCFELMKTGLKQNICGLPWYAMNEDVEDLSVRRQESIGEALVYACRFWAKHLCSISQTGDNVAQILEFLKEFLERQLLQWLEVLSIAKYYRVAVHSLIDVERWILKVGAPDEGLLNLIRECQRFILSSFDPVEQSAVHIYDSALLWSPTSSLIRTLYQGQLTTRVKILSGMNNSWDACVRSVQLGEPNWVYSVAFSHKGDLIAGCNGRTVKILEAATGVCVATLHGHDNDVLSATFSPDDVFLGSGSDDCTVKVWDVQTGALIRTLEGHHEFVKTVAFSPTGTKVASGSSDTTIRIWNLPSGDCSRILEGHSDVIRSVCWLQTNQVMSGCEDGQVKLWDAQSGTCLKTFDEYSDAAWSVACSPDASKIASGFGDGTIRVYDARTGDVMQTISAQISVISVCFSPDGDKIAYTTKASIVVWNLAKQCSTLKWQSPSHSVAFSPDGSCIAAGLWEGLMNVFRVETGDEDGGECDQHSMEVVCVSSSADGRLIASGSGDQTVKLWDAMTGLCVHTFYGHSDWIRTVAFSPDSTLVASGSEDHTIRIWSLRDHGEVMTLSGHKSWVYGISFSPDGKYMVSVSGFQEVILWDVEKWEELARLPSPTGEELDVRVSFSADGTRVLLEFRDMVKRWNIRPNAVDPSDHTAGSPGPNSSPTEMVLVPIPDEVHANSHEDVEPYRHPMGDEWILDQANRRVCWIPADRRCSYVRGHTVVLGTMNGRVVLVDLSDI